jgi:hypothetical protein
MLKKCFFHIHSHAFKSWNKGPCPITHILFIGSVPVSVEVRFDCEPNAINNYHIVLQIQMKLTTETTLSLWTSVRDCCNWILGGNISN